ncbi:MAG: MarR family transcriptional regulator [Byssovorax sp.]
MTRALVTSSKYSPGNMTPEALESLFVGRSRVLDDTLKRLAASALGKDKHYFLLVGARGTGKTHFVALLHHRISHDPAHAPARKRLVIARLNEEEWGVASFLDLLVRILQALGANDPALVPRIEQIYTIHTRDPAGAQAAAQALLVEYVGARTLLLICENLHDLFEGLGEEGQKRWRAFIQEHPFWTILATTPQMSGSMQSHKSPFYGFFTIRHLDRLDFETAALLLRQKAALDGRTDLADLLSTRAGRARARAIHHLAGGNHRAYVTLSDFLTRESLHDLVTPFMRMADDMTPYYQDRIRQLAPQQRKLVEHLSRVERPTIVKDIATRCLISQQTAAKQLGELTRLGFVEREKSGRETYYELSEPLMRLCVEVKSNRTEHLKLFVGLLREWFSGRELQGEVEIKLHAEMTRVLSAPARTFNDGLEWLTQTMARYDSSPWLTRLAAGMMSLEIDRRGPTSMATQIGALRAVLAARGSAEIISSAAIRTIHRSMRRLNLQVPEWLVALPILRSSLADVPGCELPLTLLSVGIRYVQTNDRTALLELPLEQRTLLLDAIDPPPRPEEPPLPPPRPGPARARRSATRQPAAKRRPRATKE